MAVAVGQGAGTVQEQQGSRARLFEKVKPGAFLVVGFALVAAGWVLGYRLTTMVNPAPFTPVEGISIFAVMYVFAQAIERLIEPIVRLYPGKNEALKERNQASAEPTPNPADLAAKEEKVSQERANLATLGWALTSFLAMVGSGFLGMYLLHAVGFDSAPPWLDIPITGLAIGAGTKPLHDLIKNIEKAKEEKEDRKTGRK